MKKRIHRNSHFFLNPVQVEDVWLFVEHGDYNYRKLDDEAPISAELSNNDIVHIVSDSFFEQRDMVAVYYENVMKLVLRESTRKASMRVKHYSSFFKMTRFSSN